MNNPELTPDSNRIANNFIAAYDELARRHHAEMVKQGFWTPEPTDEACLLKMVTEICEGYEDQIRKKRLHSEHIPEFTPIEEEMADLILRIMDYGEGKGHRVSQAVIAKKIFNLTRPFKHGKTC